MGRKREEERDIFFDDLSAHLIWVQERKIQYTYDLYIDAALGYC
jgi:hypothetical protein